MAASNLYTTYQSAAVPAALTPTGVKFLLPLTGNFHITEFGTILAESSAASTHVLTLKVQAGDGTSTTTGLTLTAVGETDGEMLVRRCDVLIDVVNSQIVVNGTTTTVATGINAVMLDVTTADADATGVNFLVGCHAGNVAAALTNQTLKTS